MPDSAVCPCSLIQAGTFTLTCTTDDSPVVTQTGNAVTGQFTLTKIGDEDHWVSQYNDDGAGNTYTLTGGGDRSYTLSETLNDVTGGNSPSEIGSTDAYSLTQTGNIGAKVYTQTLQATETYTGGGSDNAGRKQDRGAGVFVWKSAASSSRFHMSDILGSIRHPARARASWASSCWLIAEFGRVW